jgi:hypothetical protein
LRHAGAVLEVSTEDAGEQVGLVAITFTEVIHDGLALEDGGSVGVAENRHRVMRVHGQKLGSAMLALGDIDELELEGNVVGHEEPVHHASGLGEGAAVENDRHCRCLLLLRGGEETRV